MRVDGALQAMQQTKAEIVAAVAALGNPPQNGGGTSSLLAGWRTGWGQQPPTLPDSA
jgi:hypothetical protein